jgi:hypothetical protein
MERIYLDYNVMALVNTAVTSVDSLNKNRGIFHERQTLGRILF